MALYTAMAEKLDIVGKYFHNWNYDPNNGAWLDENEIPRGYVRDTNPLKYPEQAERMLKGILWLEWQDNFNEKLAVIKYNWERGGFDWCAEITGRLSKCKECGKTEYKVITGSGNHILEAIVDLVAKYLIDNNYVELINGKAVKTSARDGNGPKESEENQA